MNCKQMGYRAVALALAASCIAAAAGASEADGQPNREFRKLDANRDGYVTLEEARKVRGFGQARRAAEIAAGVRGVTTVKSALAVKS